MNLHEYQGKELLSRYGVKIQRGIVAQNVEEAVDAYHKITAPVSYTHLGYSLSQGAKIAHTAAAGMDQTVIQILKPQMCIRDRITTGNT